MIEEKLDNTLEVAHAEFKYMDSTDWEELIGGYDRLKVLTFSYGLGFISKLIDKFEKVEIIIGCEAMLKFDLKTIMAFQHRALEDIRKHKKLTQAVKDERLQFWVTRGFVSHEKIYILESKDSLIKNRVIIGSANLSMSAFDGTQIETFVVFDDDQAFSVYNDQFEILKELSTDNIIKESIIFEKDKEISEKKELNEIEEIPVIKNATVSKAGIIIEDPENIANYQAVKYSFEVEELAKKYGKMLPAMDKGTVKLDALSVIKIKKKIMNIIKKRGEQFKHNPTFYIDYEKKKIYLNGRALDIESNNSNGIINDIVQFKEYMNGFESFTGDTKKLQKKYFLIFNYMLLSPFIAKMRSVSHDTGYDKTCFPMYGVLYGRSNTGKTAFVRYVMKFMFDIDISPLSPDCFTKVRMNGLLRGIKGVPLFIDELEKDRFNKNAPGIIKVDEPLIIEKVETHPIVIICSNTISSIKVDLSKRMLVFYLDGSLSKEEATRKSKWMYNIKMNTHNNFYIEYLKRMIEKIDIMIDEILSSKYENWIPDIFEISSKTVIEIMEDMNQVIPEYMQQVTYYDYFNDKLTGQKQISKILNDWNNNRALFQIKRRSNTLIYSPGEKKWDAENIVNGLPVKLEATVSGNKVVMKLDAAEEFFGIRFKKNILF